MSKSRQTVALIAGTALYIIAIAPFAMAIKQFDWGVGLLLLAPFYVWLLLRIGRRLENWAHGKSDTLHSDPDFPEESE